MELSIGEFFKDWHLYGLIELQDTEIKEHTVEHNPQAKLGTYVKPRRDQIFDQEVIGEIIDVTIGMDKSVHMNEIVRTNKDAEQKKGTEIVSRSGKLNLRRGPKLKHYVITIALSCFLFLKFSHCRNVICVAKNVKIAQYL
jgi:hypothetical protein